MKRICQLFLLPLYLSMGVIPNLAAQDCKPEESTNDDFTGITTDYYGGKLGEGRSMMLGFNYSVYAYVFEEKGKKKIQIKLIYFQGLNDASVNSFEVPEGSVLRLKTSTGLLEFEAGSITSQKRKISEKIATLVSMYDDIDESQLQLLLSGTIEKYQITPTGKEAISGDVSSSKAGKFQKQVACFLRTKVPTQPTNEGGIKPESKSKGSLEKGSDFIELSIGFAYFGGHGRYEHFVGDRFSLGAGMGYVINNDLGVKASTFHLAPFIRYYLHTSSKVGAYLGLTAGYVRAKATTTTYYAPYSETNGGLYYDIHAGAKLEVADTLFLMGELALAPDGSLIKIGLAFAL